MPYQYQTTELGPTSKIDLTKHLFVSRLNRFNLEDNLLGTLCSINSISHFEIDIACQNE